MYTTEDLPLRLLGRASATPTSVTIGIYGSDAAVRITVLRVVLAALVTKHGLTLRDGPW